MGLESLIDAWKVCARNNPDAHLVIAGDGPMAHSLRMRACGHRILFPGRISEADLPSAYAAADLTVVPSTVLEGFGLVVAESLACGIPALVTPIGGLPEAVGGMDPAMVLPEAGEAALRDSLSRFLGGAWRPPDAGTCRQHAETHFAMKTFIERVTAEYERAMEAPA
jgi:glycosyltransferase involved in cell wall biosynthesis